MLTSINPISVEAKQKLKATPTDKVSDASTLDGYLNIFGKSSTIDIGRVWSDKTVFKDTSKVDGINFTVDPNEDFNVVFSTIASSKKITGNVNIPIDVVFILDLSGSMVSDKNLVEDLNGKKITKLEATVNAVNVAIHSVLSLNKLNRIAITTWASQDFNTLVPLSTYSQKVGKDYVTYHDEKVIDNLTGNKNEAKGEDSTNTQRGIAEGMKILADADLSDGIQRYPVGILLSDGYANRTSPTEKWWTDTSENYHLDKTKDGHLTVMKTLMTAAYKKEEVSKHYGLQSPNKAKVYTIGLGVKGDNIDAVLNPKENWNKKNDYLEIIKPIFETYLENNPDKPATIIDENSDGTKEFTFQHPNTGIDVSDLKYNDKYISANDSKALENAFGSIVNDVIASSPEYPTEIEDTKKPLNSGYVTFVDPIGEYMEVKQIKSLVYNGKKFPIYYENGKYVAKGTVTHPVYGEVNLENVLINVEKDVNGRETVTIKVPAALIPLIIDKVELKADGTLKSYTKEEPLTKPLRVVYSVGLVDSIRNGEHPLDSNYAEYVEQNTVNGKLNFYSNLYTKGKNQGEATVSFEPSDSNDNYYTDEDKLLYDSKGNVVRNKNDIKENQVYYFNVKYYDANQKTVQYAKSEFTGVQLLEERAQSYILEKPEGVFIKKGAARITHLDNFVVHKQNNETGTAEIYYRPEFVNPNLVFHHGNNGKLSIDGPLKLTIAKKVTFADEKVEPTIQADFNFELKIIDFKGKTITAKKNNSPLELTFDSNGVTHFTLKDNESIVIPNMRNHSYEVKEINIPDGYVSSVDKNLAKGTLNSVDGEVVFTNQYKLNPLEVKPVDLGFPQHKIIEGREFQEGDEFKFIISSVSGAPLPEHKEVVIKPTSGNKLGFDFGNFTFDKPGVYEYLMMESNPTNQGSKDKIIPGISYSPDIYKLTIYVIDNNGKLQLDKQINNGKGYTLEHQLINEDKYVSCDKAEFVNTYKADPVTLDGETNLQVLKTLNGRPNNEWIGEGKNKDSFTFTLSQPEGQKAQLADPKNITINKETENHTSHFGDITFTEAGTYKFTITENKVENNGITYAEPQEVIVEVTDNGDGQLVAKVTNHEGVFEFVNTYKADSVTLDGETNLKFAKKFVGRDLLEGESFTFSISPITKNAPMPNPTTITISGLKDNVDKPLNFGDIKYTKEDLAGVDLKEFEYEIKEVIPEDNDKLTHVSYDETIKRVKVTLTDEGNGKLSVKTDYENGSHTFVNTYTPDPITLTGETAIKVNKEFTGRPDDKWLNTDEFKFKLTFVETGVGSKSNIEMPKTSCETVNEETSCYVTANNDNRNPSFGDITFKKAGTYTFAVEEINGVIPGVIYDKGQKTITVNVTDDNKGKLTATVEGDLTFNNVYKLEEVTLKGQEHLGFEKAIVNRDWKDDETFTFQLIPVTEGAPMPETDKVTVSKPETGRIQSFNFGDIKFTSEHMNGAKLNNKNQLFKEFEYQVVELGETHDGLTYDKEVKTVIVTVTDLNTGHLDVSISSSSTSDKTFENVYNTTYSYNGVGGLNIAKTLNGHDMAKGIFEFLVTAMNDDSKVKLGTQDKPVESIVVKNSEAVDGVKAIMAFPIDLIFTEADADKDFVFEVKEVIPTVEQKVYKYDETIYTVTIHVNYSAEGVITTTTKVISNKDNTTEVVYDNKGATVEFVNTYEVGQEILGNDGDVKINASKNFYNAELTKGLFKFEVIDNNGESVAKGENLGSDDGDFADVEFTNIVYTLEKVKADSASGIATKHTVDGKTVYTYQYTVREVTDGLDKNTITPTKFVYAITVDVIDNGSNEFEIVVGYPEGSNGSLKFENRFSETKLEINGVKFIKTNGNSEVTIENLAGKFEFTIEGTGIDAVFEESTEKDPSITAPTETPTTKPTDKEPGTISIPLPMVGEKVVTTTTNDAAGNVKFGTITFDNADFDNVKVINGVQTIKYSYKVTETKGESGYINCDETPKTFDVIVTKDANGKVTAKVVNGITGGHNISFAFENTYTPLPENSSVTGEGQLTISKELTGREIVNEEFKFHLIDKDGNIVEGTNDANGKVTFPTIKFTKPGIYNYTIKELNGGTTQSNGVTYDGVVYNVTATVTDVLDENNQATGKLTVTWSKNVENLVFKNTYVAKDTAITLGANKNLDGRPLADQEFTFVLKDAEGNILQTVHNDELGGIKFEEIKFDQAGKYTYTVEEVAGTDKEITYDKTVYTVKVTVVDNKLGQLVANVVTTKQPTIDPLTEPETVSTPIIFYNVYEEIPEPTPDPKPEKPSIIPDTATKTK